MKFNLLIILIFMAFTSHGNIFSQSFSQATPDGALCNVFYIKFHETLFGSSFTIEVDGRQYLITAKHVLPKIKDKDTIQIQRNNIWVSFPVNIIKCDTASVDILILALEEQLPTRTHPLQVDQLGNAYLGQQVFLLGFPYGMKGGNESINNDFPLPVVKQGIFSIFDNSTTIKKLWIDAINNKGFSGGPVIYFDYDKKIFKIAGVIQSYRYNIDTVYSLDSLDVENNQHIKNEINGYVKSNTGLLIAYDISPAIDAIRKKPVGPKVTR